MHSYVIWKLRKSMSIVYFNSWPYVSKLVWVVPFCEGMSNKKMR